MNRMDVLYAALGRAARELRIMGGCPAGKSQSHAECAITHPDETPGIDADLCENCWWDFLLAYAEERVRRMNPDAPHWSQP